MLTTTSSDTPNNSGISGLLLSNLYVMLLFLLAVLVASALFNRKNQAYYNFKDDNPAMQKHILNTKYQLNERKKVDLDHINSIICWYNIAASVISCLVGAVLFYFGKDYNFSLTVCAVTYLVLSFAAHFGSCYHVGKIYGNNKLKN
ncbi:MAG: hypothetical protein II712_02020 [Erysipelotrichaceae bacterium]|nr:hypothetical protein [Erysipelotrichaceae bacterium]